MHIVRDSLVSQDKHQFSSQDTHRSRKTTFLKLWLLCLHSVVVPIGRKMLYIAQHRLKLAGQRISGFRISPRSDVRGKLLVTHADGLPHCLCLALVDREVHTGEEAGFGKSSYPSFLSSALNLFCPAT